MSVCVCVCACVRACVCVSVCVCVTFSELARLAITWVWKVRFQHFSIACNELFLMVHLN